MKKEFTKADLKTGYILTFVDYAGPAFVFLNSPNGDIISGDNVWFPLNYATNWNLFGPVADYNPYRVKEVYRARCNDSFCLSKFKEENDMDYELIWKREEKTEQQKQIEELEATILKAKEQIEKLKENNP